MKIVILTAGISETKMSTPKCFTVTIGSVALIEYLVRTLRLLNILPKDIYLATSKNIKWGDKKHHQIIALLGVNQIIISHTSKFSFPTLLKVVKNFGPEDVLVLNGDYHFKLSELECLLDSNLNKKSVALIQSRNTVTTKEPFLELFQGKIIKIKSIKLSPEVPWFTYYGAMLLKKFDIKKIKNSQSINLPYLDYIVII